MGIRELLLVHCLCETVMSAAKRNSFCPGFLLYNEHQGFYGAESGGSLTKGTDRV